MPWTLFTPLYSIFIWMIEINTSLLLGFSLVGINLSKVFKKTALISLVVSFFYYIGHTITENTLLWIGLFLILVPILQLVLKIPLLQAVTAILLGLIFDLMIINLLEHNVFNLLLTKSQVQVDDGIKFSLDLFITFNNLFIIILLYNKSPILFSKVFFEKQIMDESSELSYQPHIYFTIFILAILNIGLYIMSIELPYIRIHFRLFLTIWTAIICLSILFFLRASLIYKNERMQFFLDQHYQKDILSFYSVVRSQRHDFNFHLNAIYGLLYNKKYTQCIEYIEGMVEEAKNINDLLPLNHPAIGSMLNTFKELASQKGIGIHYFIYDDLRNMPCSVYEMNKILGNLLQNAIDELTVIGSGNSLIELQISNERGSIVVTVSNTTNKDEQQLENIFQIGYTTKSSHEGLGLPTIEKILSKYHGVIYPEIRDGTISFIVRIPIPV